MKNRLHDKKAGIFILVSLIIISVAEVGIRHVFFRDMISTTANYAETLAVIGLALAILIFTLRGKDRICYILYGAWIAYFVLDQFFELPSTILNLLFPAQMPMGNIFFIANIGHVFYILSMCGIIAIGCLLAEYMNDGTIYNRAFNIISFFTVLLLLVNISTSCIIIIKDRFYELLFITFNNLYRLAMIFLFTFFAYDSAKKQLSKVNFDK